jgi:phage/plasmid-like protein (TIGR03299 family)
MRNFIEVSTHNAEEAMVSGNHAFEAKMVDLHLPDGRKVPDKKAVVRSDNGAYLGTVGKGYAPVQPRRFYEMIGELTRQVGGTIDKVLNLRGGSVMGVSVTVGDAEYVPGDPIRRSFIAMTSFDCSYSVMGRAISNRWICTNQLPSSKRVFNLKHTTNVEVRLDTAIKMLGYMRQEIDQFDGRMKRFAQFRMTETQMVEWFEELHPAPAANNQRSLSRMTNVKADFVQLLYSGAGTELPGVKGTAYHALNALTEYVNHNRTTRVRGERDEQEVRFESVNFGSGDQLMQKGVDALVKLIG